MVLNFFKNYGQMETDTVLKSILNSETIKICVRSTFSELWLNIVIPKYLYRTNILEKVHSGE